MIPHESDLSRLPDSILTRNGFKMLSRGKYQGMHVLCINPSHTLLYDSCGYLSWNRRVNAKSAQEALILIPEPVRTESHLLRIMGRVKAKIKQFEK